ncbi:hypothetical protein TNCV_2142211 [Trichonephila clavipes]|uniref:Mos1 transposase HTH domain-containing protein n=1 Tax=Trichonephila clavipes TaxID=2585209 RepID=A0A8X6V679_TRICX|nr:hypothetical protein TNCV_2142211 [Trichonephila clavipes]
MMVRVYEDQALSMKFVYEWFARFREGCERVSDNPRRGRLETSVSDENIEKDMTQPFNKMFQRENPTKSPSPDRAGLTALTKC